MLVTTTAEMVRIMSEMVRRADERLAYAAARNAASSVRDHQSRRLEDARTLHDLAQVTQVTQPSPSDRRTRPGTARAEG
jgi:hypothetical protein